MLKYLFLIFASILGCVGGYNLVFGGTLNFSSEIKFGAAIGKQVVLGDTNLSSNILVYSSNINISGYEIFSLCESESKFVTSHKDLYFFEITYLGESCGNETVVLKNDGTVIGNTATSSPVLSYSSQLAKLVDYPSDILLQKKAEYQEVISDTAIYKNYNGTDFIKYIKYALGQRQYREALFNHNMIEKIISGREQKYTSPVVGRTLSESFTKVPNSPRPYRQSYTDGVHHGWDIDGTMGEDVIALDDGVIVRIVDGFDNNSDFSKIEYGPSLTDDQKLKNLDILRGNQVWLKTLKGDVVFYSHLDTVNSNLEEGAYVSKRDNLGTTGVSGVPEIGYDDYHLHFAVMKNPYDVELAGSYDFGDYMAWDWYAKGLSHEQTIEIQNSIFE